MSMTTSLCSGGQTGSQWSLLSYFLTVLARTCGDIACVCVVLCSLTLWQKEKPQALHQLVSDSGLLTRLAETQIFPIFFP